MKSSANRVVLIMSLLVAACAGGEVPDTTSTATSAATSAATSPTVTPVDNTTTTSALTTTSSDASTTTTIPEETTTTGSSGLPGEPINFGPAEGDTLAVIGVAHDDLLNLRAAPGADQEILEGIPPLHDDLAALGQTRELPGSFWIGVDYQGSEGWVNLRYIGYIGDTIDATQTAIDNLEETPSGETMLDLGFIVAEGFASEEPESDIVLVAAPTVGDLGEVTYDVIGLGDDAVRGIRVHVFGQPGSGGFTLDTVEVTSLCGRGVDDDNFCV